MGWGGGLVDPGPETIFLITSVNYFWRHHFLRQVILVKLKILYILMQWSKWVIIWNSFLYCKIIISFSELYAVICFLCSLQTHWVVSISSIPNRLKKTSTFLWWRHQMIILYSRLFPYFQWCVYTKFHVKGTKNFLTYSIFFHRFY